MRDYYETVFRDYVVIFITGQHFLQGCGVANQPYVKNDASEAAPLKMIRYETPNVRVYTTGGMVGVIVTSAVLLEL